MKVFISWSGDRSKVIASALKHWLPDVFQGLQVWMSDHDIYAGSKWGMEIGAVLEESKIGIICLTPESLKSHWLAFEAGALSTAIAQSRVMNHPSAKLAVRTRQVRTLSIYRLLRKCGRSSSVTRRQTLGSLQR